MEIIDVVLASEIEVGDTINVPDYGLVTVIATDDDDALIYIYVDEDPNDPFTFAWDEKIYLYGYTVEEV